MIIVDLNVLIYAVNSATPNHSATLKWWTDAINDEEPVGPRWAVIGGFLRLTTRGGILPKPLTVDTATAVVDAWLKLDTVVTPREADAIGRSCAACSPTRERVAIW